MKSLIPVIATALLVAILILIDIRFGFRVQDPQAMSGEWSIAVQTPPCDKGQVNVNMPERDGDVVTIYCRNMPVKAR